MGNMDSLCHCWLGLGCECIILPLLDVDQCYYLHIENGGTGGKTVACSRLLTEFLAEVGFEFGFSGPYDMKCITTFLSLTILKKDSCRRVTDLLPSTTQIKPWCASS